MLNNENKHKRKRSSKKSTEKRPNKKQKISKFPIEKLLGHKGAISNVTATHDDSSKNCDCSIDLPPEIWDIIVGYLDAESMCKYSMLSKLTLEYAFKLSEIRCKDLFRTKFPRICIGWNPNKSFGRPCRKLYYLPKIVLKKENNGYICYGANNYALVCNSCGYKKHGSVNIESFVNIKCIDRFRRYVKEWIERNISYMDESNRRLVPVFLLYYVNKHRIFDVYKYTCIIKKYNNICKKEII